MALCHPPAGDIESVTERPIPILKMPEFLLPNLGLASTIPVPGVVIYGGRQSMRLARWLQESQPVALNYVAGEPAGLILAAGLVDRWIVATFEDQEVQLLLQLMNSANNSRTTLFRWCSRMIRYNL